MFDMPLLQRI